MAKDFTNLQVAQLLRKVAAAYTIKKDNPFQIAAYQSAADAIEHATSEIKDLWQEKKLDTIPGVGEHLKAYLGELFKTGKVSHFDSVIRKVPRQTFEFLEIPGIGPKTAYKLAKSGVKNVSDLKSKLEARKLVDFSEKLSEKILQGISEYSARDQRLLLPDAARIAEQVLTWLKTSPAVKRADPLGSLRRQVATVGDIDFAVSSETPQKVITHFLQYPQIKETLASGDRKATVILKSGIQVDLMVQEPAKYGALLQHFTGSKQHNIHLRKLANERGLSLSEYGIKKIDHKGDQFAEDLIFECATEEEFYKKLGLSYIPPELREDSGEIGAAQDDKLPKLVELDSIKGDLHVHTDYKIETSHDYGSESAKQAIEKAIRLGYEYLALSDHSPSMGNHTAKQVEELINKRTQHITSLQSKYREIKILNSLEIDILSDGSLSVTDSLLATLDLVIAGVHSSMRQTRTAMTKRIISAIKSPHVDVITHPTGRLINKRQSYEADWDQIFQACVKENTALEINAWPQRLDLPDVLVRDAIAKGVKFVIDTDSHALSHLDNMKFGVAVARRGWATREDIINAWNWVDFAKWFGID